MRAYSSRVSIIRAGAPPNRRCASATRRRARPGPGCRVNRSTCRDSAVSGVRSSCETMPRKRVLSWLACSASSRARVSAATAASSSPIRWASCRTPRGARGRRSSFLSSFLARGAPSGRPANARPSSPRSAAPPSGSPSRTSNDPGPPPRAARSSSPADTNRWRPGLQVRARGPRRSPERTRRAPDNRYHRQSSIDPSHPQPVTSLYGTPSSRGVSSEVRYNRARPRAPPMAAWA